MSRPDPPDGPRKPDLFDHLERFWRELVRGPELDRVFGAGYARAADAWHLASALFLVESPGDLPFLTLDRRQRAIARGLGFPTPHPPGA